MHAAAYSTVHAAVNLTATATHAKAYATFDTTYHTRW